MKILIACEESQRVCLAFRRKGHEAYSADLQECSGCHPEYHIKGDVLKVLNGPTGFITQDNTYHFIDKWDMVIAHPPCTRLCNSGQRWLYWGDEEYRAKREKNKKKPLIFLCNL